jgi:hypothetical protein
VNATDEEVELDPIVEERRVVGLLKPYADARHDEAIAKRRKDDAGAVIKEWLDKRPGEAVFDGETGLEAVYQERRGSESYDLTNVPPALLKRLQKAKCLKVDVTVLRALSQHGDTLPVDMQPWKVPGGVTYALDVQKRG